MLKQIKEKIGLWQEKSVLGKKVVTLRVIRIGNENTDLCPPERMDVTRWILARPNSLVKVSFGLDDVCKRCPLAYYEGTNIGPRGFCGGELETNHGQSSFGRALHRLSMNLIGGGYEAREQVILTEKGLKDGQEILVADLKAKFKEIF